MFRRPYLQVANTEKNSIRLCKTFHAHSCVPAQRIDHSSVPSTPTTAFPYRSTVVGHCGGEQTSPLRSICVTANVYAMNKAQDVGYFITHLHGVVDPSPAALSIGYRKEARNIEVAVAGYVQSVCGLPKYLYSSFMHLASFLRLQLQSSRLVHSEFWLSYGLLLR